MDKNTTPHQAGHRLAVVTGATSGIGFEIVRGLAEAGWRVVGIARSPLRGRRMIEILRAQTGNPAISFHAADLSLAAEAKAVGELIARQHPQIDLLINNAGALFQKRSETAEGIERTLALNHLGYVVLTKALLPALSAASSARIVNVASAAHWGAKLDCSDLGASKKYRGWVQYQRSKLMNILFTRELARRLPENVAVNAVHPGFVATRFGHDNPPLWRLLMRLLMLMAIKPQVAAKGVLHVALEPELQKISGAYFDRGYLAQPSTIAVDDALASELWQVTDQLLDTLAKPSPLP